MAVAHFAKLEYIIDNAFHDNDRDIKSLSLEVVNGPVPPADPVTVFTPLELRNVPAVVQMEEMLSIRSDSRAAQERKKVSQTLVIIQLTLKIPVLLGK